MITRGRSASIVAVVILLGTAKMAEPSSLRFYGYGWQDLDRVKISLDSPHVPADVGLDFTIEFWMKAEPTGITSLNCNPNQTIFWIRGNIIFDRDVFGDGDYGDYGISLFDDGLAFGVGGSDGSPDNTACGAATLDDSQWHHVAVTRAQTGEMAIYVDGVRRTSELGPSGDVSYRDGRSTSYPNSDPYLVLGAEKHDDDPSSFPSYSGWLDEIRISDVVRYTGASFTVPTAPFVSDGNTVALYHLDEGAGNVIGDSAPGGLSSGVRNFGGTPTPGPEWSSDTPFVAAPAGTLQFSSTSYTVAENAVGIDVTVSRVGGNSGTVTVDYDTADGTATAASDYQPASGTLTFPDGDVSETFVVTILDDSVFEGDETLLASLSNVGGGATLGSPANATITINEDDPPPAAGSLEFALAVVAVDEADSSVDVEVVRSGGSAGAVSIDYVTNDGTATAGSDYVAATGTLDFADGQTSRQITVGVLDDSLFEGDEDFGLSLSNPTGGASPGAQSQMLVTVIDDDPQPPAGNLQFSSDTYSFDENAGVVVLSVTRTGGSSGAVGVDYASTNGTATATQDYQPLNGTLLLADGETGASIDVTLIDDSVYEGDEDFTVSISNVTGGATLTGVTSTTVTVVENDSPPTAGALRLSGSAFNVDEDANQVVITVNRVNGGFGTVAVDYSTTDGTATAAQDYIATSGTLTFPDGVANRQIAVTLLDDASFEGDETFSVTLQNPTGGAALDTPSSAVVTIAEDDAPPSAGSLQFSGASYAATEGDGTVMVTVIRSGGSAGAITVDYTTVNGTAIAGQDYTTTNGTLAFPDGDVDETFTIAISDDTSVEGSESFTVTLSNATGGAAIGTPGSATISVADNDRAPMKNSSGALAPSFIALLASSAMLLRRRLRNKNPTR